MPSRMSEYQSDLLRRSLEDGENKVADTFAMLTGQPVDDHALKISIHRSSRLMNSDRFGYSSVAVVKSEIQGDMTGHFLLVQRQADLVNWTRLVQRRTDPDTDQGGSRSHRGNAVTIPWNNETLTPGVKEAMTDLLGEATNILAGVFFSALYENYGLATFQGIPEVDPHDDEQKGLQQALLANCTDSDLAALIEMDYVTVGEHLRLWLVLLPSSQGVEALVDPPRRKGKGLQGVTARKSKPSAESSHWPGGSLIPARIIETHASNNVDYCLSESEFEYAFSHEINLDRAT